MAFLGPGREEAVRDLEVAALDEVPIGLERRRATSVILLHLSYTNLVPSQQNENE